MRVLVVEDDPKTGHLLQRGLSEDGHVAMVVTRGEEALVAAAIEPFDAIVLDVMLPGIDGFETCRQLRAEKVWTPVLLLTARGSVDDRVTGLDTGADDYLLKPFALDELLARLRALTRRAPAPRPAVLEVGALRLDPASRRAWRGATELDLTARESSLLEAFMRRPGQVLARALLLETVWPDGYNLVSNVVDVYVRYLRDKVDRPFGVEGIETVRGVGYRLRTDGGR